MTEKKPGKRWMAKAEVLRHVRLAGRLDVSPAQAMLGLVQEAAANVQFYGQLVAELRPAIEGEDGRLQIIDSEGVTMVHPAYVGAGVAGRTDPRNWRAEPNVLVKMYDEERDRLARYAKLCIDAGIQERLVRVAEQHGRVLAGLLDRVLDGLELTPGQRERLPAVMGSVLQEIGPAGG